MLQYMFSLFGWLPPIFQVAVWGFIAWFFLWSVLKIVAMLKDVFWIFS